ncbi:hypothetical protein FA15DRAFT_551557, partial [Coprinopsis marcescibilis]
VTGMSLCHDGERFQCSNETVSRYFCTVLDAVSTGPFYAKYVWLPNASDSIPDFIANSTKFFPFFQHALGAMDSTHINCCPSSLQRAAARNRK